MNLKKLTEFRCKFYFFLLFLKFLLFFWNKRGLEIVENNI